MMVKHKCVKSDSFDIFKGQHFEMHGFSFITKSIFLLPSKLFLEWSYCYDIFPLSSLVFDFFSFCPFAKSIFISRILSAIARHGGVEN